MKKTIMFMLLSLFLVGMVTATPVLVNGNPTCKDLGYKNSLKVDPVVSGTYDGITFTLAGDKKHFDWSSTHDVDAVIAKGGNNANVYYDSDGNDLVSPLNGGGKVPNLSHAVFCWDPVDEVPEFGVIAGAVALVGALGIFMYRRKD